MDDVPSLQAFANAGLQGKNEMLFQVPCCQMFCHCDKRPKKTTCERTDAFCLMAAEVAKYGGLVPCFWAYGERVPYDHPPCDLPLPTMLNLP